MKSLNNTRIVGLLAVSTVVIMSGSLLIKHASAQYGSACSEYGVMAYEDFSGNCKCMSGYVFQNNYLGEQCVSADSVCHDKYGIMSRYSSLSNSCECSYGYVLGEDSLGRAQCISDDQACQNQLGFNSTAVGNQCECSYGYVIDTNIFGDQQCTDGDQVCHSEHGYNSSYNSLSNECECDNDYTFDDDYQCVRKQHNVYFKVLDINLENNNELIIKSDYDYSKYIVSLGVGCLSSTISRYQDKNLVVNLGTDYELDMFDTVVLQDDDQTCPILYKQRTFDDSFPDQEEDVYYNTSLIPTYASPAITSNQNYIPKAPILESEPSATDLVVTQREEVETVTSTSKVESTIGTTTENVQDKNQEIVETNLVKESLWKKIVSFIKSLF
jgi:hypothetical protein